tara:strand:- start:2021 stop:2398 length:378 start_codon:yes stop_codon:yes gene_type:complete
MSYNTKNLFSNAAKNVARNFSYNEGDVEIDLPKGKESVLNKLKKAITDASNTKGMDAYQQQLNLLTKAARGAPKFSKIGMAPRDPRMAGRSSFGQIAEADPTKYLKENTNRMKQYALEKIYIARK